MEYIRTLRREFEVGQQAELSMEGRSGTITVRGEDTEQVRIEVIARLWAESDDEAEDQIELIARGIRQDGRSVTVRAPALLRPAPLLFIFGRGPRIDYQVTVPQATKAAIMNRSGRVEIEGVKGPLQIEAKSGSAAARDIGGDARIVSRSGAVQAESIAGSLTVESRSGKVEIRGCEGNVTVQSRSGRLQIEDVGGDLSTENRSGSVSVANAGGSWNAKVRSGAVRYEGAVRGPFDIDVVSGAVVLTVDLDSSFYLDAETMSGAVRSDLPIRRAGAAAPSERGPTVRIRTRSGSIHIVPR